jgi:hypothetical protein
MLDGWDIKLNRKKYGFWIRDFPVLGAYRHADETGDQFLDVYILSLNLLAFDWTPGRGRGYFRAEGGRAQCR